MTWTHSCIVFLCQGNGRALSLSSKWPPIRPHVLALCFTAASFPHQRGTKSSKPPALDPCRAMSTKCWQAQHALCEGGTCSRRRKQEKLASACQTLSLCCCFMRQQPCAQPQLMTAAERKQLLQAMQPGGGHRGFKPTGLILKPGLFLPHPVAS